MAVLGIRGRVVAACAVAVVLAGNAPAYGDRSAAVPVGAGRSMVADLDEPEVEFGACRICEFGGGSVGTHRRSSGLIARAGPGHRIAAPSPFGAAPANGRGTAPIGTTNNPGHDAAVVIVIVLVVVIAGGWLFVRSFNPGGGPE